MFRISDFGFRVYPVVALFTLYALTCTAATLVTSTVDGGGGRSSAGSYVNDASIGGIGGIGSIGGQVVRHGYPGQLVEVTSLSVTGVPVQVNEGATSQLSGTANMDDDTVTALAGSEINWSIPTWPVQDISASGVASAAVVYANTPGSFSGTYLGVLGTGSLLVLDTLPDNYGSYAGDGLPDSWQYQYFGLNNPHAGPIADPDGDGQNNQFEYVAGLVPTNAASVFVLRIASVAGQPLQKQLAWQPWAEGRTYTVRYRTNLMAGAYANLVTHTAPTTNGMEISVTDTNAVEPSKFYRVLITYP